MGKLRSGIAVRQWAWEQEALAWMCLPEKAPRSQQQGFPK